MAEKVVVDLEVNPTQAGQGVGNLKQQLREANIEAQTLAQKFGGASKQAVEAAKRVANLKEEIADVRDTIDALHPEAKFNAVLKVGQGIAGGFAAAQGAMALFGAESEDVQKALLKVQAAMALSQGLNDIKGLKDGFTNLSIVVKNSAVYTKAAAVAQAGYNFVVGAGTGALKIFRIALASTGIGAVIVGIALLVTNWSRLNAWVEKNSETLKKWGLIVLNAVTLPIKPLLMMFGAVFKLASSFDVVQKAVNLAGEKFAFLKDKIVELLTQIGVLSTTEEKAADKRLEQSKARENAIKREIELAKAEGASAEELAALEVKLSREKFLAYDQYIKARTKAGREVTQEEKDQYADLQQALKVSKIAEQKVIEDANKKELDENKKKWEKYKEQQKKANEDRIKLSQEVQDLYISNIENERERELAELQNTFNRKIDAIKGNSVLEQQLREQLIIQNQQQTQALNDKFAEEDRQREADRLQADYDAKNTLLEAQKIQTELAEQETAAIELEQAALKLAKDNADEALTREQKLLSLAQYEQSKTAIEKRQAEKRLAEEKKINEAKQSIQENAFKSIAALSELFIKDGKKREGVSKALAIGQLAIDTAKAISSTIANATQAASAGGPAAPVLAAVYIASGIATVLGNFATAKKMLGQSGGDSAGASTAGGAGPALPPVTNPTAPRLTSTDGPRTQLTNAEKLNFNITAQVVETDMTKTQDRIKDIQDKATI